MGVGVGSGSTVGVGVGSMSTVGVGVGSISTVGVGSTVLVGSGTGVAVGSTVGVGSGSTVLVGFGTGVAVGSTVLVGVGVGFGSSQQSSIAEILWSKDSDISKKDEVNELNSDLIDPLSISNSSNLPSIVIMSLTVSDKLPVKVSKLSNLESCDELILLLEEV